MHDHRAGALLPVFLKVPPNMPVPLATIVAKGPPPHSVRLRAPEPHLSVATCRTRGETMRVLGEQLPLLASGAAGLRDVQGV